MSTTCGGIAEGAEACQSCFVRVAPMGQDLAGEIYRSDREVVWDATQGWTSPLIVPENFSRLRSNLPPDGRGPPVGQDKVAIEEVLMPFLEAMIRGIQVTLWTDTTPSAGSSSGIHVIATLTADLSELTLARMSVEQKFGTDTIRWVRPPATAPALDLEGLCADVKFESGRFVRLCFERSDQCAYFTMCMRFVVKAAKARGGGTGKRLV